MEQSLQYREVERYLLDTPKFADKSSQQDTARFFEQLNRPGGGCSIVHVAGTNGKGSVCAYLNGLLRACGYKTGLFTSPHLVCMRERIRVDGEMVTEKAFVRAFCRVRGVMEESGRHLSFFELLFFMAMCVFEESGTDYIILETGLGGRLDATNCIPNPKVCVITSIGLDHMEYLGNTIAQIAAEKAGIIKPGCPVVCLTRGREAFDVISETAAKQGSAVEPVDEASVKNCVIHKKAIDFSYQSRYYNYIRLTLPTNALYQTENAALAIRALELCLPKEILRKEIITAAVSETVWEGRMEEVLPEVYVDGAHNQDGVRALTESLQADGFTGERTLLFSAVRDKRYPDMLRELLESGLFSKLAVTAMETGRSADREALERAAEGQTVLCRGFAGVEQALDRLMRERKEDERIYAVGSLYLVGEIKALLAREV